LLRATQPRSSYEDVLNGRDMLKQQLEANAFFRTLQEGQRNYILSGEQVYVGGMRAAATRAAGWREEQFLSLYSYLSSHAHSAPLSFVRFGRQEINYANPSGAQLSMAALALSIAEFCLLRVSMHYLTVSAPTDQSLFSRSELAEFRAELGKSKVLEGETALAEN
jgi:hypothetical protein